MNMPTMLPILSKGESECEKKSQYLSKGAFQPSPLFSVFSLEDGGAFLPSILSSISATGAAVDSGMGLGWL